MQGLADEARLSPFESSAGSLAWWLTGARSSRCTTRQPGRATRCSGSSRGSTGSPHQGERAHHGRDRDGQGARAPRHPAPEPLARTRFRQGELRAIASELIESELLRQERGSVTGAQARAVSSSRRTPARHFEEQRGLPRAAGRTGAPQWVGGARERGPRLASIGAWRRALIAETLQRERRLFFGGSSSWWNHRSRSRSPAGASAARPRRQRWSHFGRPTPKKSRLELGPGSGSAQRCRARAKPRCSLAGEVRDRDPEADADVWATNTMRLRLQGRASRSASRGAVPRSGRAGRGRIASPRRGSGREQMAAGRSRRSERIHARSDARSTSPVRIAR